MRFLDGLTRSLDGLFYPHYRDETARFQDYIEPHLHPDAVVLDAGCGRGQFEYDYRERVKRLIGCDVAEDVYQNPYIHEGVVADLAHLPFPDEYFDLVYSRDVLEHLPDPGQAFSEIARVLRPGGHAVFLTPNLNHYVARISQATPHWFHELVARWRGREQEDVFPTHYRANTRTRLRELAEGAGLTVETNITWESKPNYLTFTPLDFAAGILYERLVNRFEALADVRVIIILVTQKPERSGCSNHPVAVEAGISVPAA